MNQPDNRSRLAAALSSYLPEATAEIRAAEIEKILLLGGNGQDTRSAIFELLGRLDSHPTVTCRARAAAVESVLRTWKKIQSERGKESGQKI